MRPMEGNVAATYTLIYRFLKQQSQNKAAEAVKKAAKAFVVLRDNIEQGEPPLEDIIKEWRAKKNTKAGGADSSSKDSESPDDSSSDEMDSSNSDSCSEGSESEDADASDSDDSSDDLDEGTKAKALPRKGAERDTSVTLSSTGDNVRGVLKQAPQIPEKDSTKDMEKVSKSNKSESNSPDSDSSSKSSASGSSDVETSFSSSNSSNSSDSSNDDGASKNEKALPTRTKTTEGKSSSSSESSSDSEGDSESESESQQEEHVAKKRKTSENGVAVMTAVTQQHIRASHRKEKLPPKVKERFQRIKVENLAPEQILNNGYKARGGATNDYGERAHRDLVVTRGAGFRKEKNKKKRGSYRGGEITMENHSIKFDF